MKNNNLYKKKQLSYAFERSQLERSLLFHSTQERLTCLKMLQTMYSNNAFDIADGLQAQVAWSNPVYDQLTQNKLPG